MILQDHHHFLFQTQTDLAKNFIIVSRGHFEYISKETPVYECKKMTCNQVIEYRESLLNFEAGLELPFTTNQFGLFSKSSERDSQVLKSKIPCRQFAHDFACQVFPSKIATLDLKGSRKTLSDVLPYFFFLFHWTAVWTTFPLSAVMLINSFLSSLKYLAWIRSLLIDWNTKEWNAITNCSTNLLETGWLHSWFAWESCYWSCFVSISSCVRPWHAHATNRRSLIRHPSMKMSTAMVLLTLPTTTIPIRTVTWTRYLTTLFTLLFQDPNLTPWSMPHQLDILIWVRLTERSTSIERRTQWDFRVKEQDLVTPTTIRLRNEI